MIRTRSPVGAREVAVHAIAPLAIGASIYLLCRQPTIPLFAAVDALGLTEVLNWARGLTNPGISLVPRWLVYSAPASCWAYAFCAGISLTWKGTAPPWNFAPVLGAIALVGAGELAQVFPAVPGTFDVADLASDTAASVLASIVIARTGVTT